MSRAPGDSRASSEENLGSSSGKRRAAFLGERPGSGSTHGPTGPPTGPQAPPARRGRLAVSSVNQGREARGSEPEEARRAGSAPRPRCSRGTAAFEPLQADNDLACVQRIIPMLEDNWRTAVNWL